MHRPDFVPVSTNSEMRHKFDQQGMLMEEKMGKKFFCCDAVLDLSLIHICPGERRVCGGHL